jgi:two-component system, cell cycle sensor histidine kinase and response regulator CckA
MSTAVHPIVLPSSAQEVLVRLVRLSIAEDGSNDARILERLTELAASGMGVARASVWLRDETLDAIVCQELYDGTTHSHGTVLRRADFPSYFTELDRSVVIPAEDAHHHPATACFSGPYLQPLGIGAMLDAPIWRGGKAVGVLCLEHLGGSRSWSDGDQSFAMQVALICGLYYERQDRLVAERALRLQQEREHTNQKMEALGRMACAIGHDFNNLLTTIMGQSDFLMRPNLPAEQVRERAGLVIDAATRAGALVKRLLTFGKGRDITEADIDLAGVVRSMQAVLRSTLPKRIFLDLRLPDEAMTIKGDAVSLEQVVMNLVVNARDAISDYGTITVTVTRGVDEEHQPTVVMKVADSGCGMDQATLARAFDPFYTTKGTRGTGLGLSTCFTNMRRMGGRISITSSPGQGTTCVCTFPTH